MDDWDEKVRTGRGQGVRQPWISVWTIIAISLISIYNPVDLERFISGVMRGVKTELKSCAYDYTSFASRQKVICICTKS